MRILVDENLESADLLSRLRRAGHHVETVRKGSIDPEIWRYARSHRLAVLTANARDFLSLAEDEPRHDGLLLVYGERDPHQRMDASAIAAAVERVRVAHGDAVERRIVVVNEWRT